jgi:mono-ADP-ribosyltransferase sirtuin 6
VIERFDSADIVAEKVGRLADWVKTSQHFVVFTGAGVSTSAGIPDFRGPNGIWTLRKQGKSVQARHHEMLGVVPTAAHMIMKGMCEKGILKHVISTNTDGIHRRSGLSSSHLTEIHGNTNEEDCPLDPVGATETPYAGGGCGSTFYRDERCRREGLGSHEHSTGRICPNCGKDLQDTIINFDENLRHTNVQRAQDHARKADVMLVMGSSLRVSSWPAQIAAANPNAKLIVCNLQWTPFSDSAADLVIHARSDQVMHELAQALAIEKPAFAVRRKLRVTPASVDIGRLPAKTLKKELERVEKGASQGCVDKSDLVRKLIDRDCKSTSLQIEFENDDGRPLAVLRNATAFVANQAVAEAKFSDLEASCTMGFFAAHHNTVELQFRLSAHFDEPLLVLHHELGASMTYDLLFEPNALAWSIKPVMSASRSEQNGKTAISSMVEQLKKCVGQSIT